MATLKDLDDLLTKLAEASAGMSLQEFKRLAIGEVRREFQGQKIYVAAPDTSKKQMVLEAALRLPTGVVATRCGVSNRYVQRLLKKR
jgi:hypothetical protein